MKESVKMPTTLEELEEGVLYRFTQLSKLLKSLGLPYSRFTIRGLETWRCTDYNCGFRNTKEIEKCEKCGSKVELPKIVSPRIGSGHRRYSKQEVEDIVKLLSKRDD